MDDALTSTERDGGTPAAVSDEEQARQSADLLGSCDASKARGWIGRRYSPASDRALLEATGAKTIRPIRPGEMVTMDFLSDRLTLDLDESDRITAIRCG